MVAHRKERRAQSLCNSWGCEQRRVIKEEEKNQLRMYMIQVMLIDRSSIEHLFHKRPGRLVSTSGGYPCLGEGSRYNKSVLPAIQMLRILISTDSGEKTWGIAIDRTYYGLCDCQTVSKHWMCVECLITGLYRTTGSNRYTVIGHARFCCQINASARAKTEGGGSFHGWPLFEQ